MRLLVAALVLSLAPLPAPLAAQLQPPSSGGLAALDEALRPLARYQRVLMIAAHPDDEDTELLTLLVRGMGSEAGYLSLTRGEGGQNLIGDELGAGLGLLRTEELLAARRLDGARQFFSRAYDFGFSKTLDDTWAHWPRDSVLKDVVRIVRRFRPQVVVSIFRGAAADGHGQHQAAGWAAHEAFRVAGDERAFPELAREEGLEPWAPLKLYRSTRFDSAATTLTLPSGGLDPAVGQSYHQIAMRGRSLHRSQDMGQLQRIGPSDVRLRLVEDRTGRGGAGLFAGLDTTLEGVPLVAQGRGAPRRTAGERLRSYAARVDSARLRLAPPLRAELRGLLRRAAEDLDAARRQALDALPGARGNRVLLDPVFQGDPFEGEFRRLALARMRAQEILADGVSADERVVPGQRFGLTLSLWNPGDAAAPAVLCVGALRFGFSLGEGPDGPTLPRSPRRGACLGYDQATGRLVPAASVMDSVPPGTLATAHASAEVPYTEGYSTPYFLRAPRQGDLYFWDPDEVLAWGTPFGDPVLWQEPLLAGPEPAGRWMQEIAWRGNDQAEGEYRRPVTVVPRVDVALDPEEEVWPVGRGARRFTVTLVHGARDTTTGTVELVVPRGWSAPPAQGFRLTGEDERQVLTFQLRAPAGLTAGRYEIAAVARDARGRAYDVGLRRVDHAHIHPRTWTQRATAAIHATNLVLPRLRSLAYVRGAADRVPESLRQLGLPVTLLRGADLARTDLRRHDVVVIGPRAYETDPDLAGNNGALLAYARNGGTVVVQYQQYGYFLGGYAPFGLTVGSRGPGTPNSSATPTTRETIARAATPALLGGHDRVADESAPVRVVDPASPLLRHPNRIVAPDWNDWVQERGLYFARSWAPEWRPVISLNDPGEPPLEGGLLVARVGRGTYVYTGLSFFRQLPQGVPGAYRLFANLLALGERPRSSTGPAPPPASYDIEKP